MWVSLIITLIVSHISYGLCTEASPGQFPYQATFFAKEYYICSGAIISEYHVLTAAHCVFKKPLEELLVTVGNTDLRSFNDKRHKVCEIVAHPKYVPNSINNDIALVKLCKQLTFDSKGVNKIELVPSGMNYKADTSAIVSGYGTWINGGYKLSNKLNYANVQIWDKDSCNVVRIAKDNSICAGNPKGVQAPCLGNSGDPLVANNKLYGVYILNNGCHTKSETGVYAFVGAYREWIKTASGV